MKKRNLLLAGAAAAVLSLSSCKSETKTEEKNEPDKEVLAKQQQREDDKFFRETYDALLEKYGFNKEEYYRAKFSRDSLKYRLEYLDSHNYKSAELNEKVDEALDKIGKKYAQKIENLLVNTYKLYLSDEAKDILMEMCDSRLYKEVYLGSSDTSPREWNLGVVEYQLENKRNDYSNGGLWDNVDMGQYGETRQQEIKDKTLDIFKEMFDEQDGTRLAIAKTYADYYPDLDPSKIPEQYRQCLQYDPYIVQGEADYVGYDDMLVCRTDKNAPIFKVYRSVSVYDSKLSVDFFNKEGASYKLDQIKPGQWQVERKDKNGKVSRTPVFNDNVDYKLWVGQASSGLEAIPGANIGVRIDLTERVFEIPCKDDRRYSPEELKAVKLPLENALKLRDKTVSLQESILDRAQKEAQMALEKRQAQRDKINTTAFNTQKKGKPRVY